MDNNEIVEADFEEVTEDAELQDGEELVVSADAPKTKMGLKGFLSAITAAVGSEQITTQQAQQLRRQMGISQAYFTRNRNSDEKKVKARRKAQKAARKANRRK